MKETLARSIVSNNKAPDFILEEFADHMYDHFVNKNNTKMSLFLAKFKVSENSMVGWLKRNEYFRNTVRIVREVIAERHLERALNFKAEKGLSRFMGSVYSKKIRETEEFLSSLKNKNDANTPQKITFQLDPLTKEKDEKKEDNKSGS